MAQLYQPVSENYYPKMIDFLTNLVAAIIFPSENITITEEVVDDIYIYNITVPATDMGKIIGKGGKVINSLRLLARVKAHQEGKKIAIKIVDVQ